MSDEHTHTYTHTHGDAYPYYSADHVAVANPHDHDYAHTYGEPYYPAPNAHSDAHGHSSPKEDPAELPRKRRGPATVHPCACNDCWPPDRG